MNALRIYVAGPYSADSVRARETNVNVAIDTAIQIFRKRHFPYVPHLSHFVDARAQEIGQPLEWNDYLVWDEAWLDVCDALLYLGPSRGADRELQRARASGMLVFMSVADIPDLRTRPAESTA